MWLIVGLGNPGAKYLLSRHNVGFMALDYYLNQIGHPPAKKEHKSLTYSFTVDGEKILMVKPQTFMNHSGEAVQSLTHFYKIPPQRLLVIHDEIEQSFGQIKLQVNRGHGGQNGVRDIHEKLGTKEYHRLRVGVGRPEGKKDVSSHVLSSFSKEEQEALPQVLERVVEGMEELIFNGLAQAANKINQKA